MALKNHIDRLPMTEELHSRPFPVISAPAEVSFLALRFKSPSNAQIKKLASILGLPDASGNNHYYETKSGLGLKWEQHTEFQSFTLIEERTAKGFPEAWLQKLDAEICTRTKLSISKPMSSKAADAHIIANYSSNAHEALAVSHVLDKTAVVLSDFKLSLIHI